MSNNSGGGGLLIWIIIAVIVISIVKAIFRFIGQHIIEIGIGLGVIGLIVLIWWLLKKRKEKYIDDNYCPICHRSGKLNGKDNYLNVYFNNEICYACEGKGYTKDKQKKILFEQIKEYDNIINDCSRQINMHQKNCVTISNELKRGVRSNYEEKKRASALVIEKNKEKIQFYETMIGNITMLKTIDCHKIYDRKFTQILKRSSEFNSDHKIEEKTVQAIYLNDKIETKPQLLEINSLIEYLNDKTDVTDSFRKEIDRLTRKIKDEFNGYS